jgi:hypothetical protein
MDTSQLRKDLMLPTQLTLIFLVLASPTLTEITGPLMLRAIKLSPSAAPWVLFLIHGLVFFVTIWVLKKYDILYV